MYKTTNMIMNNPIYLLSKNNATAVIGDYIFGSTVVKFDGDIYIQNRKLKKTAFSSHSLVFSQTQNY